MNRCLPPTQPAFARLVFFGSTHLVFFCTTRPLFCAVFVRIPQRENLPPGPHVPFCYCEISIDDLVQVCYCIQRLKFFPNNLLASTFERGSSSSTDINLIKLSTLSLLQKLQQPAIIRRMPPDLVEVPLQELAPIVSPKTKK